MEFSEVKDAVFSKLEEAEGGQKKISALASPLLKLLRSFTIFSSEFDSETLNNVEIILSGEGNSGDYGKICRIAYFILSEIGMRCGPDTIKRIMDVAMPQLEGQNTTRQHAALRVIGFVEPKVDGAKVKSYLTDVFKSTNPAEMTGSDEDRSLAMVYFATIHRLCGIYTETPPPFIRNASEGSTMEHDYASRESLGALSCLSMNHPKETFDLFKGNFKDVNINTPLNAIYYYRTLCMLSLSNTLTEGDRGTCYDLLINGLKTNDSLQVVLEICKLLFRFSWTKLLKSSGSGPVIQQILDKLYQQTENSSHDNNNLELYSICTVWCMFGGLYVRSNDDTNKNIQLTFNKVINIIQKLIKPEISNALLSKFVSTYMWLLPVPGTPESDKMLEDFTKLISTLPTDSNTVTIIMDALTPRLMISTAFSIHFLKLISTWCPNSRDSLSSNTMSTLWIHSSSKEPDSTLSSIFHVLDSPVENSEHAWRKQKLHCAAYWVLGEAWKNFVRDTRREKFYNSDKQGWDYFDSPVVRNILVRLIEAIHLGNWIIRRCAISSIIKIALICKDPLKIKLYEFLLNLKDTFYHDAGTCNDDLIDTGLDALDCYYESLSDDSKKDQLEKRLQLFAIRTE